MSITVWLVVDLVHRVHGVHRAHGVRPVPFRSVVQRGGERVNQQRRSNSAKRPLRSRLVDIYKGGP